MRSKIEWLSTILHSQVDYETLGLSSSIDETMSILNMNYLVYG